MNLYYAFKPSTFEGFQGQTATNYVGKVDRKGENLLTLSPKSVV